MKKFLFMVAVLLITVSLGSAKETVSVQVLTKGSNSWDGNTISYAQGLAEISVVKIHIPFDIKLPLHCHPTPLAAYVTRGALEVTKKSGEKMMFKAGDAFIEVMNSWHSGRGIGQDTELIVFYAGTKNIPLSVKEDGDPVLTEKCR